ncbi:MAG: DUF2268 domain-containing putative Zn-dependent protease [Parachlamydiaceae bacterium]
MTPIMMQMIPMNFAAMGACDINTASSVYSTTMDELLKGDIIGRIQAALEKAFQAFKAKGDFRFPETLQVGVFISDGKITIHNELNYGFTGFGCIPGFIVLILSPTEYVLKSIEALVVHEFHHNIRFLIEPWPQDMNITVGKYLLDEGMAEAFAAELYGEPYIGPQTIGLSADELSKAAEIILPHAEEKGFQNARKFLFGDAMADACDYQKTGLPHGAGYAVGYQLMKKYFAKTGKNIFDATLESSEHILREIEVINSQPKTAEAPNVFKL